MIFPENVLTETEIDSPSIQGRDSVALFMFRSKSLGYDSAILCYINPLSINLQPTLDGLSSTALHHHTHITSFRLLAVGSNEFAQQWRHETSTTSILRDHRNHRVLHECMHPAVVASVSIQVHVEHTKIPQSELNAWLSQLGLGCHCCLGFSIDIPRSLTYPCSVEWPFCDPNL